jgi:hypothetical protein
MDLGIPQSPKKEFNNSIMIEKMQNGAKMNDITMLHYMLGHIHETAIKQAILNGHIKSKFATQNALKQSIEKCPICMISKAKQQPRPRKSLNRTDIPMNTIHCDESGERFRTPAGNIGFSLIIDEGTLYNDMHLFKAKNECQQHIRDFVAYGENKHCTKLKKIRSDNAKEYIANKTFVNEMKAKGIEMQQCIAYKHAQNGLVEREIGIISTIAECNIQQSGIPDFLRGEAFLHASLQRNFQP